MKLVTELGMELVLSREFIRKISNQSAVYRLKTSKFNASTAMTPVTGVGCAGVG